MLDALKQHWPEYLMEAAELALFMLSACVFVVVLEHPDSPIRQAIPDSFLRRALMGLAMGLTAVGIIYSPLGKRSGAHFNPAVTLTFYRLGKVRLPDAFFYVAAQFIGGVAGVVAAALLLGLRIAHRDVNYAATLPGPQGTLVAFLAEVIITLILMTIILHASNAPKLAPWTGLFAGTLVAAYITLEAPLSGMSMNPARTFGSAFIPRIFDSLWIYFTAPLIGMLLAAEIYLRQRGIQRIFCAKLHHQNAHRCIFRCGYSQMAATDN